jgi:predicted nucleic acid-binding Zn ribbon protein
MDYKNCSTCNIKPNIMEQIPSQHYVICPKCGKLTQKITAITYDDIKENLISEWNDIN